jgi:hypothetical protein
VPLIMLRGSLRALLSMRGGFCLSSQSPHPEVLAKRASKGEVLLLILRDAPFGRSSG